MNTNNEFSIKIDKLSDAALEVFATLTNLNISFENNSLFVELKIDKNSSDPRIGQLQDSIQLRANNSERIKVVNSDGTPSMVIAKDVNGQPIQRVITPPQPIYQEMKGEDGQPLKDEEGNLIVDSDGKPIMELIGHTDPVLEDVYVQETIGEFEMYKLKHFGLIQDVLQAIFRSFEDDAEEVVFVKSEE